MSCGCEGIVDTPVRAQPLVVNRNDIFPMDHMPSSGVGSMTVLSLAGSVVLHHVIDVRDPGTFSFTEDEVARIVTGLLSDQSFDAVEKTTISGKTELAGMYVIGFPDHVDVEGSVTVVLQTKNKSVVPLGCGCARGCSCRQRPTLHADVLLESPRVPEPIVML